jgi:DNA-binding MarR family transcriptional regulator
VGVLPAQMSRILKALEQRYDEKLVLCSINSKDKRKIDVSITPRGRRAVEAYRQAKIKASIAAFEALSDRDLAYMAGILEKMANALQSHAPAPPSA